MLLTLASFALATHVETFVVDPAHTKGRYAGLEKLVIDPAATTLTPAASQPKGHLTPNAAAAGEKALAFTNPMSAWGWVEINGVRIGTVGPYATFRVSDTSPGWYGVSVQVDTGYRAFYAIEVK